MRGRFRLTKTAKVLALLLVIATLAGLGFAGVKTGFIKHKDKKETKITASVDYDENGNVMTTDKTDDKTINLSLDEWIG